VVVGSPEYEGVDKATGGGAGLFEDMLVESQGVREEPLADAEVAAWVHSLIDR
jgi:hypothetical protein